MRMPAEKELDFSITLRVNEKTGAQSATISVPEQSLVNVPLDDVHFGDQKISFKLTSSGIVFEGRSGNDGQKIFGVAKQDKNRIPFRLALQEQEPPNPQATPAANPKDQQRWKGVTNLPGMDLEFMVTFSPGPTPTGWTGTVDIPLQGVKGMVLTDVSVGNEILFTIQAKTPGAPAPAKFKLKMTSDNSAEGSFDQAGSHFKAALTRVTDPNETVELPRPQTPKPPFPYTQREVSYTSGIDGVTLAGTLTVPDGAGLHPAVLMITGSGAQDRDESLAGHKPFWVIADYLSRRGIAVLRLDDRGVGGSGGDTFASTVADNAKDVLTGVEFLKQQAGIDPTRIGLLGHSEGGWVAPIAAAQSDDVAFIVLLAAPGVTGKELLLMQRDLIRKTVGVPAARRLAEYRLQTALLDAIDTGAPDEKVAEALRELALQEREGAPDMKEFADRIVKQQLPSVTSTWFRDILGVDARPALRKLKIPVLAIAGELDLQVPPEENLKEIREALESAGNTHVTIITMPGLNHLLQLARQGLPSEYLMLQQTIAPEALETISDWIREQTNLTTDD